MIVTRSCIAAGFIALGCAGGYIGFMLADQEPPVVVTDMRIEPGMAPAGATARRVVKFYRKRACETRVQQLLFAGPELSQRFVLPDLNFASGILPLGPDRASIPLVIPATAPPGPAMHRAINTYYCNFMHRWRPIRAEPRDIHFTIAAPGKP